MNFSELQKQAAGFSGVLALETVLPHRLRAKINDFLSFVVAFLAVPALLNIVSFYEEGLREFLSSLGPLAEWLISAATGLCLFSLAFWLVIFLAEAFYFSHYFKNLDALVSGTVVGIKPLTFEAAEVIASIDTDDITLSFLNTTVGHLVMIRSGILPEKLQEYLNARTARVTADKILVDSQSDAENGITITDLALAVLKADREFGSFLLGQGVDEKTFLGASLWVVRGSRLARIAERWWSRENLGRIEGVGKDWAYGGAYILDLYSKSVFGRGSVVNTKSRYLKEETVELENVLSRTREANALIVGETTNAAYEVVAHLARLISEGEALPALEHKRVVVLDQNKLVALAADKSRFERELIRIFEESLAAGNVILVFDDLAGLITSASAIGSDVSALMDPYLISPNLQVVAVCDNDRFHRLILPSTGLMARFEKILLKGSGEETVISVLQDEAIRFEAREKIFFTYPAIETIAKSADRYFPSGVMPDKAVDLLIEIIPHVKGSGRRLVGREDVLALVEGKTGIPIGEVKTSERDKLIHLEELLHRRVVGQDEAVKAISASLRRARASLTPTGRWGPSYFSGQPVSAKPRRPKLWRKVFSAMSPKF